MSFETVVRSRTIVTPTGTVDGWIGIDDGKIVAIGMGDPAVGGHTKLLDWSHRVTMPGMVDSHVHIRYPGHPDREDFETGTRAAAAGGVTTVLEMPISLPPSWNADLLQQRMSLARGKVWVDVGFYGAGGTASIPHIEAMAEAGAVGYKIFMHRPQAGREAEFEGLWATDTGDLYEVFRAIGRTGLMACVHAEDDELVSYAQSRLEQGGRGDPRAHAEAHPVLAETLAIDRALSIASQTDARLSICHVSSGSGADRIRQAKRGGLRATGETCPHYLFRTEDDMDRYGAYAKINPPLRTHSEQKGLWDAVRDGTIDFIGSDHAPYTLEEKERGRSVIWNAPSGCPGLETTLPLLLKQVAAGNMSWTRLAQLISERAAVSFGLSSKGAIVLGRDADLVGLEMTPTEISHHQMHTKVPDTAALYEGESVPGQVAATMVRGTVVYHQGQFLVDGTHGRIVRPDRER